MSTIIAVKQDGKIYMGCDTQASGKARMSQNRKDKKMFIKKNGNGINFGIGACGSFRFMNILQYGFSIPSFHSSEYSSDDPKMEYMVNTFVEKLKLFFKERGVHVDARDKQLDQGGYLLVAFSGRLFHIMDDYQVAEYHDDFLAIGSGGDIAKASLITSEEFKNTNNEVGVEKRISLALECASKIDLFTSPPFIYQTVT
ncbi:hypothetical protein BPT24_298 [Tenacibaculum phage pT24]|uniref:Uncharacterized protein n=1 Tax=Tenacibaculum phage pT24 TaxID=1880590 RepID=A0A1B4XX93_9CAUD|nr:peptidase HslV family [Tenacibaculum phage pT24]BAV39416.1 hypothetical protein BPT24_298 [Tenacibaculum phage pT24]